MTVKEHYHNHLGNFYSWMSGNFLLKQQEFERFLKEQNIKPKSSAQAIDLGAGHGVQSVALANLGFKVKAIDFNRQLLDELMQNAAGLGVEVIEDDIKSISKYSIPNPELIVCWGDTLTHLESAVEIEQLLTDCCEALTKNGQFIIAFRDYSAEVYGDNRFIPIKSDDSRILTCFLDYHPDHVIVTDLLYEREETGWKQKISSYNKTRVSSNFVKDTLEKCGINIIFDNPVNRLTTIIAVKT